MGSGATFRLGVDENGLGARLGPLVVTAVLSSVEARGARVLSRKLPKAIRADLDDSKRLISHADARLGEAWARALIDADVATPAALFEQIALEGRDLLHAPCPSHVRTQCWGTGGEVFAADDALCQRISRHRRALEERGIKILAVRSSIVCTKRLNDSRDRGINRFVADLHAMETLILDLQRRASAEVVAICGKVGGIAAYGKFFGPLAGRLHAVLEEGAARSAYRFPGLGELHFVRDADACDPLVMLASLVGKYVRELLMARITRFYPDSAEAAPSGYHDPVSAAFVARTVTVRRQRRVPDGCFERAREPVELSTGKVNRRDSGRVQLRLWEGSSKP